MSLQSFPVELIGIICRFCDLPSVKALRLTCRVLCHVANDYLFPEVIGYMNLHSMTNIRKMASQPQFAKSVRHFWFQADAPQPLDFGEWYDLVLEAHADQRELKYWHENFPPEECLHGKHRCPTQKHRCPTQDQFLISQFGHGCMNPEPPIYTEMELRDSSDEINELLDHFREHPGDESTGENPKIKLWARYQYYQELAQDVDIMILHNIFFDSFRTLLENCSGLNAIEFTLQNEARTYTSEWNKTFQNGSVFLSDGRKSVAVFVEFLKAANAAGFTPTSLRLDGMPPSIGNHVKSSFVENLEVLELDFRFPDYVYRLTEPELAAGYLHDWNERRFAVFAKHARRLKSMSLTFQWVNDSMRVDFGSLVENHVWPQLASFSVNAVETTSDTLANFLLRHSETLQAVELKRITLHPGWRWPECFGKFAGKLPKLISFELRGVFEQDGEALFYDFGFGSRSHHRRTKYETKVSEYVRTPGSEFPKPPRRMLVGRIGRCIEIF